MRNRIRFTVTLVIAICLLCIGAVLCRRGLAQPPPTTPAFFDIPAVEGWSTLPEKTPELWRGIHCPVQEGAIPATALRPVLADFPPTLKLTPDGVAIVRLEVPGHGPVTDANVEWHGPRTHGGYPFESEARLRWSAGDSLQPPAGHQTLEQLSWEFQAHEPMREGVPSGRNIGDRAVTRGDPASDHLMIFISRGPAGAEVNVRAHGLTDVRAAQLAEDMADRFCERVDAATAYIQAPEGKARLAWRKLPCKQLSDGTLVAALAAVETALGTTHQTSHLGEIVTLQTAKGALTLATGCTSALLNVAAVTLRFPTLQWGDADYLIDCSTLAQLLR